MIYITIFVVYFIYVFLRAFQQRNVIHNNYMMILPVSYGMALCDAGMMYSIATYATDSWELIKLAACAGTGGGIGCIAAMLSHDRMMNRGNV
jgi:hypothetical protein